MQRKTAIIVGSMVIGIVGIPALWIYRFNEGMQRSLEVQKAQHDAVRPLLEAVTLRKIKVGDTLAHVEEVFRYAELEFTIDRQTHPNPTLYSGFHTGPGSGFSIIVEFDSNDRVRK